MAHIHEAIDFVVVCYIIRDDKVLLCHHKKLGLWLPIGGHVELNEDTDQALFREIHEECGLQVEIVGASERSIVQHVLDDKTIALLRPQFMEIHPYDPNFNHRHIALVYIGESKTGELKQSDEHIELKWLTVAELEVLENTMLSVKFYGRCAIRHFQ